MCVVDLFHFPHGKGLLPYSLIVFMNDVDFSYALLTFYPDGLLVLEGCTQISFCTRWAYFEKLPAQISVFIWLILYQ